MGKQNKLNNEQVPAAAGYLPMTIREAYVQASSFLAGHGVEDYQVSAEQLLMYVLDWDRTTLLTRWNESFSARRWNDWQAALARRAAREPVQYIVGEADFYGLSFTVTPDVLIPRPETELLVEAIVNLGNELYPDSTPHLVDIGTGSGAIAVSLASQCPRWRVTASDLSNAALEVAGQNAERSGVSARITFAQGSFLQPFITTGQPIDILVSNPPYIESAHMDTLQAEVRRFEPHLALDGGPDGLAPYRTIIQQLSQLPALPKLVGFEVGAGQAPAVATLLREIHPWHDIRLIRDLAGIERHVIAIRA